jgi:putative membrane-bound dehydrogenase-like protein
MVMTFAGCTSSGKSRAAKPVVFADNDVTDQFDVPDGMEVRVWARTPQLFNPTNIDVDARGRIFVAEGVNYRETWKKQNALTHPNGDRIMILEDTDGDGMADSSKVFVEDKDLLCPLGVAVLGNKVVVSCSPNLIVYTDADGDDVPEKKEILLTGFGGKDHDHGLHSVTGDIDGKWYFNVGNDGPHEVKDANGWWLHSGSCYVYGPTGNTGNRKSDDGRVWTGGVALGVDPDGKNLRPLAHNFRNSYEIARDSFGNMWQSDNDDDGNRGCRTSFVMEGGNMGYFSADGTRTWQADRRPGQESLTAQWHQDDPGVIPLGDNTGAGGPTGVVVYEGGALPKEYVGAVFDADAGRNRIWLHKPVRDGAGFKFERSTLIAAKIPTTNPTPNGRENWFRPSDVAVGTDGAIYISDWYDPGVGGHDIKDKEAGGRILRLAPRAKQPAKAPVVDLNSLDGQLAAMNNPAINVRYAAAMKLRDHPDKSLPRLEQMSRSRDAVQRARAITLLAQLGEPGRKTVVKALADRDERIRIAAFRALRDMETTDDVVKHARALAGDLSPAVRREVAIAMRDVPFEQCKDVLLTLAKGYDGRDRFYLEAFGIACDGKEAAIYPLLLQRLGRADPFEWSDVMIGLAWRLHPAAAVDAFARRANAPHLSSAARQQALTALAFTRDEKAADAMNRLRTAGVADVRPIADWWLKNRSGNEWKDFAAARHYAAAAVDEAAKKQPATKQTARRENDLKRIGDPSLPKGQREIAAVRLAADPEGAMAIIAMASDKKFPAELQPAVAGAIYRNPDLSIRAMASTYFPRQASGGVALPPLKELAKIPGDAARGRAVFFGNTASCSRCHAFDRQGKDVGPDLTAIRTKYQRPELLDAILNPSAAIAFGYEAWIVQTTDGEVYSGFILADADTVVLKESSGEQRQIPKGKIKKRVKQPMSVMPDNVGLGLTAQELADVAEFLLKAPITGAKAK